MNPNQPLYTIKQVSQRTNIPNSTLRFWEKQFSDILQPIRSKGGQRRYMVEHIAVVREIKKLRDRGLSLAEIKSQMASELEAALPDHPEIELLATRLGQMVRDEIYRFYQHHLNDR